MPLRVTHVLLGFDLSAGSDGMFVLQRYPLQHLFRFDRLDLR